MSVWRFVVRSRDWIALITALAIGPMFIPICGLIPGISFASAMGFFFIYCAIGIPLVTVIAKRWRIATWQIACASIAITYFFSGVRDTNLDRVDVGHGTYIVWVVAVFLSSPVPIFLLLRPLQARWRIFFGIVIGSVAAALVAGIKIIRR
jgi:hypothetical protein